MKKLLLLGFFLFSFVITPSTVAAGNSFVSVVNPVRGSEFWEMKDQKPETAVLGQIEILESFNLPATWLIRFDALDDQNIIQGLKKRSSDEKGLFLEITPTWTDQAEVPYRKSASWHSAGSAFLTGYERPEREKLIEAAFEKFKTIWGSYPQSVGAWWIDSYSLEYMQEKYGIVSALIVSDQYSTDNYQIWGQYFSTPYYPSKNNALHPAQNLENKLDVVMTQWAPRDPVNSYGNGVAESTFSVQANDYIDYHKLDTKYFSSLIDIYTKQQFNSFAHVVVGLENSYEWSKYADEYGKQLKILAEKAKNDQFSVIPLKDFVLWYKLNFPKLSPAQLIIADDPLGSFKKTVWFMNPYYRVGWFYNLDGSVFRDIRQYIDGEEELCFKARCDSVNFATSATRVLDEVSFGHKWIIDQGRISNFKVEKTGEEFLLSYTNEAGNLRKIKFLPRDIGVDGKISSIDGAILNATKKDNTLTQSPASENGVLKWSPLSLLLKLTEFTLFLIFAVVIPGFILTKNILNKESPIILRLFVSAVVGLAVLTLVFYVNSLFKIKFLVFFYILISLIFFIRYYSSSGARSYLKNYHRFLNSKVIANYAYGMFSLITRTIKYKLNLVLVLIILLGTIFQIIPTFRSGLTYQYGMGFWGPNTHDGVWHMALINQLMKSVPAENPVFSGTILKNYHFFYDLLITATSYLSSIPVVDLVFRFYPVVFSLLLGTGSYYLVMRLFEKQMGNTRAKVAAIFSLYLIYFAGSFGWIVEFLRERHFGGESAFWVNQAVSFNLNPPFAISLLIMIVLSHILLSSDKKRGGLITAVLIGTLMSFKSYTGILVLAALAVVAVVNLLKRRNYSYCWISLLSMILAFWLLISNFEIGSSLVIFAPFWFIHSMVDSPDRVGWVRLSLARTSSQTLGAWPKFFLAETVSLFLFIAGNLGLRILSFGLLFKAKKVFDSDIFLFISVISAASVLMPILFVQSGNPWNTIQFFYPALYLSALFTGIVVSHLIFKLNKISAIIFVILFLIFAPINSVITANGYLGKTPHAFVSRDELAGLKFLAGQSAGVVLTFPYDGKLKQKIAEPWPILAYDSTAYVSSLSGKNSYLEDEPQNQILLTDYKKRIVAANDFFLKGVFESAEFLQDNYIKYIYLPKIYGMRLDENTKPIKNIFENEEVVIYKITGDVYEY